MAIDKVKAYFANFGMAERVLEFDTSSATVELAAQAVGCAPKQITKTMSFLVDGQAVLIALAGDARISNPKFKQKFHTKAVMLPPDRVEAMIGHAVGGVCPFAVNDGVTVYLDESLKRFEIVYPAAGSASSAIGLTIPELETHSHFREWIDVSRDWE